MSGPPLRFLSSSGGLTLDKSGTKSQVSRSRPAYSDLAVDLFRASEQDVKSAGISFIAKQTSLVPVEDLNVWERRPSGVYVVGTTKSLLCRLIRGESIKDQASGAIRTATGSLSYLNLSQLIAIRQHSDPQGELKRSAIPELRDFGLCLEEALNEKLISALLAMAGMTYTDTADGGGQIETFSHAERKFLGRRLLLHLGVLTFQISIDHVFPFEIDESQWYLFCGSKSPNSVEDCHGLYFRYPSLKTYISRRSPLRLSSDNDGEESQPTYVLAELPDNVLAGDSPATQHVSWHILCCPAFLSIDELVRASLSFKKSVVAQHAKGAARHKPLPGGDVGRQLDETQSVASTLASPGQLKTSKSINSQASMDQEQTNLVMKGEDSKIVGEAAAGDDDEEAAWGPVEYDEAIPVYYDIQQETYFYYGNILYYDPDCSYYYYYDWEHENYTYIDEETQQMVVDGALPIWNAEDGQYYDASSWSQEVEETVAKEEEEDDEGSKLPLVDKLGTEKPVVVTTAYSIETELSEEMIESTIVLIPDACDAIRKSSMNQVVAKGDVFAPPKFPEKFTGSIDQFQSSEAMLTNRALKDIICMFDRSPGMLEEYERRPNGTLRVGRNRRTFDGLIKGSMELKSLTSTECADISSNLKLLNLPQLLYIRKNAQNSAWDKSPLSTLKTFAMKTDSLIAEKFVVTLMERGADSAADIIDLLGRLTAPQCRYMGSLAIFVVGAMGELKNAKAKILGEDYAAGRVPTPASSWWFLPSSPLKTGPIPRGPINAEPKGVFMKFPDLTAQFDLPEGVACVYKLVAGRQISSFLHWDVLEIAL